MPTIPTRRQQPSPVSPQVPIPGEFPAIPQEVLDRFPTAKDWQTRLNDFWGRTAQAMQEAQRQTAAQVNSTVIWTVDRFLIYTNEGNSMPMFELDATGIRLGNVLVINTPGRKIYIGAGVYANANTPFYVDTLGNFSLGDSFVWDADTDTLTITGIINATSGTIGGFDIGADYIRDSLNSFGLASTVTGGDDVRFWAGETFANRASAVLRITESGVFTGREVNLSDVSGTDNRFIAYRTSGVLRWQWYANGVPESGGNAGSDIALARYADDGSYIQAVLTFYRNNGSCLFSPEARVEARWNGIGVTSTIKLDMQNEAVSTSALNQWSPCFHMLGSGWKTNATAASVLCHWKFEVKTATGTALPTSRLVFSSDVANSPSYVERVSFDSGGMNGNIGATTPGTGSFTTAISTVADGSFGLRVAGATGRIRFLGYSGGTAFIDAVNTAEGATIDLNISGTNVVFGAGGSNRMSVLSTGVVQIANLAGVGTRTVVADASGNLSAP